MAGTSLLKHENTTFTNQVVYITGNAYINCKFDRCTLVLTDVAFAYMQDCTFGSCVWHCNFLVHDLEKWNEFLKTMVPMISGSVPNAPSDEAPPTKIKPN